MIIPFSSKSSSTLSLSLRSRLSREIVGKSRNAPSSLSLLSFQERFARTGATLVTAKVDPAVRRQQVEGVDRRSSLPSSSSSSSPSSPWCTAVKKQSTNSATRMLTPADVQLRGSSMYEDEEAIMRFFNENEDVRNAWVYSKSFADFYNDNHTSHYDFMDVMLDDRMQSQLRNAANTSTTTTNDASSSDGSSVESMKKERVGSNSGKTAAASSQLPRTLEEALNPDEGRAIVVTEATKPFRIHAVNDAWEKLCGYDASEAVGKTLGSLLHGPKTDHFVATTMIHLLLRGEHSVTTTLVNYTKDGREFSNRLQVGPLVSATTTDDGNNNTSTLRSDEQQATHFVGILREINA